ncbi:DUF4062 domain-containing protein [Paenarthrobacter sp. AT5]|uniref:DUF4062 domain-containing protein n=1 Tax=Paenarthrobacter TaxID=1742992 RepID=UPI001A98AFC4|nr:MULTISPECIES: DUF4062 domain-containing protein [Paenarthrobacter]QSZ54352.1 hypothetical protein AYX19_16090 [Paenarthrobacter ureafaciens]WOC62636.1 DUF4062 domain-containing protein [Paenarthrobacter sp. AT5]
MTYPANVLSVMIASPSDLPQARDAVEEAISSWNVAHSRNRQIVLLPWRWEDNAVPTLGDRPQALINAQGVDQSDIVFALFGSRLGSPTGEAISGTVEEIERAEQQGKHVHVYFSNGPLPNDVDVDQLAAVRDFKNALLKKGLLGEFSTPNELSHEVWKAIEFDLAQLALGMPNTPKPTAGVDLLVQPRDAREPKELSRQGKQQYTTRRWLEITNKGGKDAENVRVEVANPDAGLVLAGSDDGPATIHREQMRKFPIVMMFGAGQPIVRVLWTEDGKEESKEFHVG